MARKFSELRSKMSAESQARAKALTAEMLGDMRLADLRRARELTQQQLATELKVNQAWISKVERQTDMYLSTLRAYIEAIGGELDLIARFGEYSVRINQLNELDSPPKAAPGGELSTNLANSIASGYQQIKVAVYQSSHNLAPRGVELWQTGASSNTGLSSTPDANTTSPTSKAA
jgi:transcriptional regulator with XRE-family HTH domain